jgi:hypothetical protein
MDILSKRLVLAAILVVVVILFVWGIVTVALLRFEQGDSFAQYSSFRADPLGCRGLYGALDKLPGVDTRRHPRPLSKLDGGINQTVMVLGLPAGALLQNNKNLEKQFLRLASEGSRVLIAAKPPSKSFIERLQKRQEEDVADKDRQADEKSAAPNDRESGIDLEGAQTEDSQVDWELSFLWQPVNKELPQFYSTTRDHNRQTLPEFLDIHTPLRMVSGTDSWRSIYRYGKQMVVAERDFGAGSLVVFVDAYPFSNESLRTQDEAELLAWMLGDGRDVVFAEAHLGVVKAAGLMTLIQRYRMDGILFSLLLVAILVVWKNAFPLVPPPTAVEGGVAARDHFSGLVNLLQRHIPLADLSEACHREWRRSLSRYGLPGDEQRNLIQKLVKAEMKRPVKERHPLALYRKISKIVTERNI